MSTDRTDAYRTPAPRTGDETQTAAELETAWKTEARWAGVQRDYSAEDVVALRGSVRVDHTLARRGAENLWSLIHDEPYVNALGALTGNQAVQQVRAGLKAIYLSGWQVAADANLSGQTYPDQSLYPANSVPAVVKRINNALLRADQIATSEGAEAMAQDARIDWLAPIVADAEAGFGGPLNAYELMTAMIEAGAAGVHWEDQLASEKKCGHMGGKVLVPTQQHIRTLNAARLAADVAGVPTHHRRPHRLARRRPRHERHRRARPPVPHGRPHRGGLLPHDAGHRHRARPRPRLRALRRPALGRVERARPRARAHLRREHPRGVPRQEARLQLLAVLQLEAAPRRRHHREVPERARRRWATRSSSSPSPASTRSTTRCSSSPAATSERQMSAYVELQEAEFASEANGYTATKHQREVGTGYFDRIATALNPASATLALVGSTESAQFH